MFILFFIRYVEGREVLVDKMAKEALIFIIKASFLDVYIIEGTSLSPYLFARLFVKHYLI